MSEERRLVTVLFADVVGSTTLGEAMDPEDLRRLLGRFYAIASEVVAEHGGTLEKFIGDALAVSRGRLPREGARGSGTVSRRHAPQPPAAPAVSTPPCRRRPR